MQRNAKRLAWQEWANLRTATQRAALRMMIVPSTDRKEVRVWKMTRSMTVAKRSWESVYLRQLCRSRGSATYLGIHR